MRALALLGIFALGGCAQEPWQTKTHGKVYVRWVRHGSDDAHQHVINPGWRGDIWGTPEPPDAPQEIRTQPNLQPEPQ